MPWCASLYLSRRKHSLVYFDINTLWIMTNLNYILLVGAHPIKRLPTHQYKHPRARSGQVWHCVRDGCGKRRCCHESDSDACAKEHILLSSKIVLAPTRKLNLTYTYGFHVFQQQSVPGCKRGTSVSTRSLSMLLACHFKALTELHLKLCVAGPQDAL